MKKKLGFKLLLFAFLLAEVIFRILLYAHRGIPDHVIGVVQMFPLGVWFDWALGAYIADAHSKGTRFFVKKRIWVSFFLFAFIASTLWKPASLFSFTFASVLSGIALEVIIAKQFHGKVAVYFIMLGTISYSVYLWHQPIIQYFDGSNYLSLWEKYIVGIPIIIGLAWISYFAFERLGVRLGNSLNQIR